MDKSGCSNLLHLHLCNSWTHCCHTEIQSPAMKTLALAALLLAACTDNDADPMKQSNEVGKLVTEMCGQPPLAPGFSASFSGGTATMSTADYQAITKWRDDVAAWRDCAAGIGLVVEF